MRPIRSLRVASLLTAIPPPKTLVSVSPPRLGPQATSAMAPPPRSSSSSEGSSSSSLDRVALGAVSVSLSALLVGAEASVAMDAASLYAKVEPERPQKNRFSGTETGAAKDKALGKTSSKSAPATKAAAPSKAKSSSTTSAKKKSKSKKTDAQASSAAALAAVVAIGGVVAANATRDGDSGSSSGSGASGSPAKSDAAANAKDAQKWIDNSDWAKASGAGGAGAGADTPEGRAADAQAWIDAWKKKQ